MARRLWVLAVLAALLSFSVWALPPYPPPDIEARVTRVIDGDTIEVELLQVPESLADKLPTGSIVRIRYIGVNAPEAEEPKGPLATQLNRLLVTGKHVFLEVDERLFDKHGRLLAYVYLDPYGHLMVNAILIMTQPISAYPPDEFVGTDRYDQCFQQADQWCLPCNCVNWDVVAKNPGAYEGEVLWVCGPVKSTARTNKGHIFINLGNPYPQTPRFTIVIWDDYVSRFDEELGTKWEEALRGETLCVRGKIKLYKGTPEIEAADPDQIKWGELIPRCCQELVP